MRARNDKTLCLLGAAAIAVAACNSGPTTSVTQTIGNAGGTIVLDKATVTFPANALSADTSITITESTDSAPSGYSALSPIYHCGPTGTTFASKVTMAMNFSDDGKGPFTMFWSAGADPSFHDVGGTPSNGVMSAGVLHFSSGFVGRLNAQ
jgi:hypothetical protein